ncbi:hypothetical protein [Pseudonocardia cypriaca]|nr:hypothetical protein [Pseudonocardia cypriaca]
MDAVEYEAVRSRFAERAEAAARDLLADPASGRQWPRSGCEAGAGSRQAVSG